VRCLAAVKRAGSALALVALASSAHAAGDAAVGRGRFGLCEACHGVRAEGNASLEAPSLAGREGWYLARQLENFRAGRRGTAPDDRLGQQMRSMALTLESGQAVEDVVAYVTSLPHAPSVPLVRGDAARGKTLYASVCTACHGDAAQGNEALQAPALKGVSDWYLLSQIGAFRNGWRGTAASDTSGAQMRSMAMTLPDDAALNDVVAYIASLETSPAVAPAAESAEAVAGAGAQPLQWSLASDCPPSFEQLGDGTCDFRSLYDVYASVDGHGGLRARLPSMRARYSAKQIDLGKYLFFDRALSHDQTLACADCHNPRLGFSDARGRSLGIAQPRGPPGGAAPRRELDRGAPTLWNVGFLQRLFWDGRAATLAEQASGPLFAADEMANTPAGLTQTLNAIPAYRALFADAYARESARAITIDEIEQALAAFQSSLVSFNSRYDRYAFGDASALTPLEQTGHNVFRGFVARCSQCHVPPLFTDGELAVIGAPAVAGQPYDKGAGRQSDDPALVGAFRTPTLRNIALTAPYFNAGQFATLRDVVSFYNDTRGHAVPKSVPQQVHWHIAMKAPQLSEADVGALVAFLGALTDESLKPRAPEAVPSGLPVAPDAPPLAQRVDFAAPSITDRAASLSGGLQPLVMSSVEEACRTCPH
jgi:cytochrome c peroxidase